jgi:uncharacterized protein (DUF983 family)
MDKTDFIKVICPKCGKKQFIDISYKMITCQHCGHQWMKLDKKESNFIGILLIVIFIAFWVIISEVIIIKTHLPSKDSYIAGIFILLFLIAIIEIFIRIIQYLSKKK